MCIVNLHQLYDDEVVSSLVVSEDVLEEMPVNGGEEGIQLVLFQQGGSIPPVEVCAALSGLRRGRLERGEKNKDERYSRCLHVLKYKSLKLQ